MKSYFVNPFGTDDPERRAIWEMLVARDSDAFATHDWALIEKDFSTERFEGVACELSSNPDRWKMKYPRLEDYRDDWLRGSQDFTRLPLRDITHREFIYKLTSLKDIEIQGDRALAHKKFSADEPLTNGERKQYAAQSLYRLHKIAGEWKIVGFVGYLPLSVK